MSLKKKILVSSLAVSVSAASLATLPLSANGFLEKLGVHNTAFAAESLGKEYSQLLIDVMTELIKDEEGVEAVLQFKNNLKVLDTEAFAPIFQRVLVADSENTLSKQDLETITSKIILSIADAPLLPPTAGLQELKSDPEVRRVLGDIARIAGFKNPRNDLTTQDIVLFQDAVRAELLDQFVAKKDELVAVTSSEQETKKIVKEAFEGMYQKVILNQSLKVSQLFRNLDIKVEDVLKVWASVSAQNSYTQDATAALFMATVRTQAKPQFTSSDQGRTNTPVITIEGTAVPSELVTWKVVSKSSDIVTNGKVFTLSSSVKSASADIQAIINIGKKELLLYSGKLNMSYSGSATGGGGGGSSTPDIKLPSVAEGKNHVNKIVGELDSLLKVLTTNEGQSKARQAVEEAIRQAGKIDVSGTVKIEKDVATASFDVNKLAEGFKSIKEIADQAAKALKEKVPNAAAPKVVALLDLGTVKAGTVKIPLLKDLAAKAKEYGIDAIAVQVNGVSLTLSVAELTQDTTITLRKEEASVTSQAVASDVYDFTFEAGGKAIESFSSPVEVRLPVTNASADKDLLVFAKIEGGKLTFKGGSYDAGKQVFLVNNKSFSTYAVVENKVTFQDLKDVQQWAGRQIAVAAAKGILEGRAEQQFVPQANVTRAEFAKMIVKAFGLEDAAASESFTDVNDSDWFKPYVAAAAKAGIINGRTDTLFAPNANISRAEMATMASRALEKAEGYKVPKDLAASLKVFRDADAINETLKAGVSLAAEEGIVVGEENSEFHPNADSTRAQAAVVIYRLLNK
ncbi:hypothetical protein J31TS4_32510 [Paenibacillus sp. J31TS4]|uniref:S-layer homology domain-containing protein n=1 Tax=Paenibacillus sp. J31TS4 TaxID=2807195 RepID=UPI001B142DA6|nr:S-layer homology domain-containing protein [Paenibacillus sp. J31TS4]GIP39971.1 hypothetical protein J31TS4_32510 [Paenibacillus sp. J31TS4]